MAASHAIGFGSIAGETGPHFLVTIPGGEEGEVVIVEQCCSESEAASPMPRRLAALSLERWLCIENEVRVEFNQRLRRERRRAGVWKNGENLLAVPFGQELTLLCWAIEAAGCDQIRNAFLNWAWFTPEERQWLFTILDLLVGAAEQAQESGWRRALRIALIESPAENCPPRPKPEIKAAETGPLSPESRSSIRKKKSAVNTLLSQPTLPCLDEEL